MSYNHYAGDYQSIGSTSEEDGPTVISVPIVPSLNNPLKQTQNYQVVVEPGSFKCTLLQYNPVATATKASRGYDHYANDYDSIGSSEENNLDLPSVFTAPAIINTTTTTTTSETNLVSQLCANTLLLEDSHMMPADLQELASLRDLRRKLRKMRRRRRDRRHHYEYSPIVGFRADDVVVTTPLSDLTPKKTILSSGIATTLASRDLPSLIDTNLSSATTTTTTTVTSAAFEPPMIPIKRPFTMDTKIPVATTSTVSSLSPLIPNFKAVNRSSSSVPVDYSSKKKESFGEWINTPSTPLSSSSSSDVLKPNFTAASTLPAQKTLSSKKMYAELERFNRYMNAPLTPLTTKELNNSMPVAAAAATPTTNAVQGVKEFSNWMDAPLIPFKTPFPVVGNTLSTALESASVKSPVAVNARLPALREITRKQESVVLNPFAMRVGDHFFNSSAPSLYGSLKSGFNTVSDFNCGYHNQPERCPKAYVSSNYPELYRLFTEYGIKMIVNPSETCIAIVPSGRALKKAIKKYSGDRKAMKWYLKLHLIPNMSAKELEDATPLGGASGPYLGENSLYFARSAEGEWSVCVSAATPQYIKLRKDPDGPAEVFLIEGDADLHNFDRSERKGDYRKSMELKKAKEAREASKSSSSSSSSSSSEESEEVDSFSSNNNVTQTFTPVAVGLEDTMPMEASLLGRLRNAVTKRYEKFTATSPYRNVAFVASLGDVINPSDFINDEGDRPSLRVDLSFLKAEKKTSAKRFANSDTSKTFFKKSSVRANLNQSKTNANLRFMDIDLMPGKIVTELSKEEKVIYLDELFDDEAENGFGLKISLAPLKNNRGVLKFGPRTIFFATETTELSRLERHEKESRARKAESKLAFKEPIIFITKKETIQGDADGQYLFTFYPVKCSKEGRCRYYLRRVGVLFEISGKAKKQYATLVDALAQETLNSLHETTNALDTNNNNNNKLSVNNEPLLAICGLIEEKNQFNEFISMNGALKFLALLSKEVRTNTQSPLPIMEASLTTPSASGCGILMIGKEFEDTAAGLCSILHETNKTYLPMKKESMGLAVTECYESLCQALPLSGSGAPETHQHLQRVLDSLLFTLCKFSVAQGQYEDSSSLKSPAENGYAMFAKTCYSS